MALFARISDDWLSTEQKLLDILADAPDNRLALDYLVAQWQSSGYLQDSWVLNEKALQFDLLRPVPLSRRALKLWIMGKAGEADSVAARAVQLYPSHPMVWNARFLISAFTGRWQAARQLLAEQSDDSLILTPAARQVWSIGLEALESRSTQDIAAARSAGLEAARRSTGLASQMVLVLSVLGEIDAAYEIMNGLLLRQGDVILRGRPDDAPAYQENNRAWRATQWLFTPATRPLRADSRFSGMCDAIGLSSYWSRRGIPPDADTKA